MRITAMFAGVGASAELQAKILREAAQISAYDDDVVRCHVRVGCVEDRYFQVQLRVTLLGGDIIAVDEPHERSDDGSDLDRELHSAFARAAAQVASWRGQRTNTARLRSAVGGW